MRESTGGRIFPGAWNEQIFSFLAAEGGLPQIGKPCASTTALHTPAPLSFTFTEKKGDIPS